MKINAVSKSWINVAAAGIGGGILGAAISLSFIAALWNIVNWADWLGFMGGIAGGLFTLIAAIIAFRPAQVQTDIAQWQALDAELRNTDRIFEEFSNATGAIRNLVVNRKDEIFFHRDQHKHNRGMAAHLFISNIHKVDYESVNYVINKIKMIFDSIDEINETTADIDEYFKALNQETSFYTRFHGEHINAEISIDCEAKIVNIGNKLNDSFDLLKRLIEDRRKNINSTTQKALMKILPPV